MKKFEEYRATFTAFYNAVAKAHRNSARPHRGHGLDHDVTVAQIAAMIAPDERTAEKAWCASLLHSIDRMVEKNEDKELFAKNVADATASLTINFLPPGYFTTEEEIEIWRAACRHGELNQEDQSITQQVLMDADRLANLQPAVVIRAGQFMPELPAFEFEYLAGERNLETTYYNPKSVLDDLRNNIAEYVPKLRLPKAKELAAGYVATLEGFISALEKSYRDIGLVGISL